LGGTLTEILYGGPTLLPAYDSQLPLMLPVQPNNGHIQANDSFQGGLIDQFEWPLTSVYSPNSNVNHWQLWEELAGLISWWVFFGALGQ
jgi:hypothetical protein